MGRGRGGEIDTSRSLGKGGRSGEGGGRGKHVTLFKLYLSVALSL